MVMLKIRGLEPSIAMLVLKRGLHKDNFYFSLSKKFLGAFLSFWPMLKRLSMSRKAWWKSKRKKGTKTFLKGPLPSYPFPSTVVAILAKEEVGQEFWH